MTPCPQVIESVLKENEKRLNAINAPYDPVRGNPRDPNRFRFKVDGIDELWLPVQMKGEPLVADLLRFGSLAKYLYKMKSATSDELAPPRSASFRGCAAVMTSLSGPPLTHI